MKAQESAEERSARRAANAAIFCAVLTVAIQVGGYFLATRDKHKEELMEHRRQTLITALEVADHVYANISMSGKRPTNPHEWDISLARNAMNGIIIYCKDPNKVLAAFSKAVGMFNPDTQKATPYGPKDLTELRNIICEELEVSHIQYADPNVVWISDMPGAK